MIPIQPNELPSNALQLPCYNKVLIGDQKTLQLIDQTIPFDPSLMTDDEKAAVNNNGRINEQREDLNNFTDLNVIGLAGVPASFILNYVQQELELPEVYLDNQRYYLKLVFNKIKGNETTFLPVWLMKKAI
jgi:hypothetical protein